MDLTVTLMNLTGFHLRDDDYHRHHHCCSGDDDDERESAEHDGREEEDSRCNFVFIVISFTIVFTDL